MRAEIEHTRADTTQRTYARLAGFLFLAVIIVALGSGFVLSSVAGRGTFVEVARRVTASERLYRVALSTGVLASVSSVLLAFALYVTLKTVDNLLAQLALIFSVGDAFLGLVVRVCGFATLRLYVSAQGVVSGPNTAQALSDLMRGIAAITENIGGISFGIGLLLFFYLFFRSRYIPRILAALGLVASAIWIALYSASLAFPELRGLVLYVCFPAMGLADVGTGFYLMLWGLPDRSTR